MDCHLVELDSMTPELCFRNGMCHTLLLKTLDSMMSALKVGCWIHVQQYWVIIGIRHSKVVHCGLRKHLSPLQCDNKPIQSLLHKRCTISTIPPSEPIAPEAKINQPTVKKSMPKCYHRCYLSRIATPFLIGGQNLVKVS